MEVGDYCADKFELIAGSDKKVGFIVPLFHCSIVNFDGVF